MRINSLKLGSVAEVKDHFADIIFFQGCNRECCYCFNPELITRRGGRNLRVKDVHDELPDFTDVVVLSGGEPLDQNINALVVNLRYKGKRIIVETSKYNTFVFGLVEKVIFCIKTFDLDEEAIKKADKFDKVDFVIVIGHNCFDMDGFKRAHELVKNNKIYHRYNAYRNTFPVNFQELYAYVISKGKQFLVFNKICL